MWIGAIRLAVATKDARFAGTDSLVQATLLRNDEAIFVFNLDYPREDDLERGALRNYDYSGPAKLARRNDRTPELPRGVGRNPMPYPDYGVEFSDGLDGHLKLLLRIHGDDMWIKDDVDLYVRYIQRRATSFDTLAWVEDRNWSYVGSWGQDVPMSTDSREGPSGWTLSL